MSEPTPSTAVERRPVELGGAVLNLDDAIILSKTLAMAAVMPAALRGKGPDVLAMILYGQDLGLSPMQAIQGIYVVNGKPQMSAQLWIALARRAGHRISVLDHTVTACTVEIKRGDTGEEHRETFTIEDAQRAKLAGKDVWLQYPKRMLLARAVSDCCRFICPEIAFGFYAEGDDFTDTPDPITTVEPVAETEVIDADVVDPETAAAEVAALDAEFDFAQPEASPEFPCEDCGPSAYHSEAACPNQAGA